MTLILAITALALGSHQHGDLAQPPPNLSEEAGAPIGETLVLANDVSVRVIGVIEDSRCPIDVTCIQAGRLVVSVLAKRGNASQGFTMEPWSSVEFAGGRLTFSGAPPRGKAADGPALKREARYDFLYSIEPLGSNPQPDTDAL